MKENVGFCRPDSTELHRAIGDSWGREQILLCAQHLSANYNSRSPQGLSWRLTTLFALGSPHQGSWISPVMEVANRLTLLALHQHIASTLPLLVLQPPLVEICLWRNRNKLVVPSHVLLAGSSQGVLLPEQLSWIMQAMCAEMSCNCLRECWIAALWSEGALLALVKKGLMPKATVELLVHLIWAWVHGSAIGILLSVNSIIEQTTW